MMADNNATKTYTREELDAMGMMERVKAESAMYDQQDKNKAIAKQKAADAMRAKDNAYKAKQVAKNKLANKNNGLGAKALQAELARQNDFKDSTSMAAAGWELLTGKR